MEKVGTKTISPVLNSTVAVFVMKSGPAPDTVDAGRKDVVPPLKPLLAALYVPSIVRLPPLTRSEAAERLEPGSSACVPAENSRVLPPLPWIVPVVLLPPLKSSVPWSAETRPALVRGTASVDRPLPDI